MPAAPAPLGPDDVASHARRRPLRTHAAPPPPPPPSTPPTPLAELRPLEPPREPLILLPASQQHGEIWALPSARSAHAAQLAAPKSRRRLRGGSGSAHQAVVWATLLAMALRAWQRRTARQIQARVARGGRPAHSPLWAFVLCRPPSYAITATATATAGQRLRTLQPQGRTEQPLRLTPTTRRLSAPHAASRGGKAWTAQGASALVPKSALTRRAARAHLRVRLRCWRCAAAAVAEALAAPVRAAAPRVRHRARARAWARWRGSVARQVHAAALAWVAARVRAARALRAWAGAAVALHSVWRRLELLTLRSGLARWRRGAAHAARLPERMQRLQVRPVMRLLVGRWFRSTLTNHPDTPLLTASPALHVSSPQRRLHCRARRTQYNTPKYNTPSTTHPVQHTQAQLRCASPMRRLRACARQRLGLAAARRTLLRRRRGAAWARLCHGTRREAHAARVLSRGEQLPVSPPPLRAAWIAWQRHCAEAAEAAAAVRRSADAPGWDGLPLTRHQPDPSASPVGSLTRHPSPVTPHRAY